jgi:CBS domain-containing protein
VVDDQGRLLGLVSRQDALEWRVAGHSDGRLADALSDASTDYAFPETPCGEVADMMVESGVGRVAVVDPTDRTVIGIVSRQDLLKVRSQQMSVEKR